MILLVLLACDAPDPCAGTRDLMSSPGGLALVPEEHPGWGSTECFLCHQRWTIHAADCLEEVAVEPFDAGEPADCVACHGSNGVAAWEDSG